MGCRVDGLPLLLFQMKDRDKLHPWAALLQKIIGVLVGYIEWLQYAACGIGTMGFPAFKDGAFQLQGTVQPA